MNLTYCDPLTAERTWAVDTDQGPFASSAVASGLAAATVASLDASSLAHPYSGWDNRCVAVEAPYAEGTRVRDLESTFVFEDYRVAPCSAAYPCTVPRKAAEPS